MKFTALFASLSLAFAVHGDQQPSFVTLVARPIVSGPPAPKPVAPKGTCGRAVNLPNLVSYEWLMGDGNCHGIVPDGNVGTSWIEIMGGKVGYTNCKECEFWRNSKCEGNNVFRVWDIILDDFFHWDDDLRAYSYKCKR